MLVIFMATASESNFQIPIFLEPDGVNFCTFNFTHDSAELKQNPWFKTLKARFRDFP